jgi:hypothetical protein
MPMVVSACPPDEQKSEGKQHSRDGKDQDVTHPVERYALTGFGLVQFRHVLLRGLEKNAD